MVEIQKELRLRIVVPSVGLAAFVVFILSDIWAKFRLRNQRKSFGTTANAVAIAAPTSAGQLEKLERAATKSVRKPKAKRATAEPTLDDGVSSNTCRVCQQQPDPGVPKKALGSKLNYLDRFLKWESGIVLLEMGLFPNAKEITESMGCLQAIDTHLKIKFSEPDTLCLVVGDGATPRTAALMAVRTKWHRIVSVDPALSGLPCFDDADSANAVSVMPRGVMPREQRHENYVGTHVAGRNRMRSRLARIAEVDRLELRAAPIEDVVLDVDPSQVRKIIIVLPHAHVAPDVALGSLRFSEEAVANGDLPVISVVQLPCCKFVKHGHLCGSAPDVAYNDELVLTDASTVRVWRDVTASAVELKAVRIGEQALNTRRRMAQEVRSDVAREEMMRNTESRKMKKRNPRPQ